MVDHLLSWSTTRYNSFWSVAKCWVLDRGPYILFRKLFFIIKRRLESEIKIIPTYTITVKFGRPLAIIVHYTVQFLKVKLK